MEVEIICSSNPNGKTIESCHMFSYQWKIRSYISISQSSSSSFFLNVSVCIDLGSQDFKERMQGR